MHPVTCAELFEQVFDITLDSELAEMHLLGDFAIRKAIGHKTQDRALALAQGLLRVVAVESVARNREYLRQHFSVDDRFTRGQRTNTRGEIDAWNFFEQ